MSTGATGTVAITPSGSVTYVVYHVALKPAAEPADPPAVTGLSPSSGSTAGGTSVTITGTDLTGATSVTFGGTAATGVTVVNDTTITCTSPAHTAGTVQVQVTTPAGSSANTAADDFTYQEPPAVAQGALWSY